MIAWQRPEECMAILSPQMLQNIVLLQCRNEDILHLIMRLNCKIHFCFCSEYFAVGQEQQPPWISGEKRRKSGILTGIKRLRIRARSGLKRNKHEYATVQSATCNGAPYTQWQESSGNEAKTLQLSTGAWQSQRRYEIFGRLCEIFRKKRGTWYLITIGVILVDRIREAHVVDEYIWSRGNTR